MSSTSASDWKRIEDFVGFGRADAPIVLIGMQEGLKDAEALDEDLAIRSLSRSQSWILIRLILG